MNIQTILPIPLTDREKFDILVSRLQSLGFRILSYSEIKKYRYKIDSFELFPPKGRKVRPGQVAMIATCSNGYMILVYLTFSFKTNEFIAKGLAAAWVLILNEKGVPRHKSRPIRRVGNFCNRILQETIIQKMRVDGAGICECGSRMDIFWGKNHLRQRYFKCSNGRYHRLRNEKTPTRNFNYGLTGKYLSIVLKRDKKRSKYAEIRREMGKDPQHAMKNRKKWRIVPRDTK